MLSLVGYVVEPFLVDHPHGTQTQMIPEPLREPDEGTGSDVTTYPRQSHSFLLINVLLMFYSENNFDITNHVHDKLCIARLGKSLEIFQEIIGFLPRHELPRSHPMPF